jgi:hypothetical protein
MSAADKAKLDSLGGALVLKGSIVVPADFPTLVAVQVGWTYIVTANVTDSDVAKTNTGQTFVTGNTITWNGVNWTITNDTVGEGTISEIVADHVVLITEGVILSNPAPAAAINVTLPPGATYIPQHLAVKDKARCSGSVAMRLTIIPDGAETIEGAATFVIDSNGASVELVFSNGDWSVT